MGWVFLALITGPLIFFAVHALFKFHPDFSIRSIALSPTCLVLAVLGILGALCSRMPVYALAFPVVWFGIWTISIFRFAAMRGEESARLAWRLFCLITGFLVVFQAVNLLASNPGSADFRMPMDLSAYRHSDNFAHFNGLILILFISFPMAGLLTVKNQAHKALYGLLAFFVGMAVVGTYSRSALFALLVLALTMPIVARRPKIVLLQAAAILGILFLVPNIWDRIAAGFAADLYNPFTARFDQWRAALIMSLDYPFYGVGLGYFCWESVQHLGLGLQIGPVWPHSIYMTLMTHFGIASLVFFLFMFRRGLGDMIVKYRGCPEPESAKNLLRFASIGMMIGLLAFGVWDL